MPNEVSGALGELPLSHLIGAPLIAAGNAQEQLAGTALKFINQIGFEQDAEGTPTNTPRLVSFNLNRPVIRKGEDEQVTAVEQQQIQVNAPFLGLVPIPALMIDDVQIDFQMEITATTQSTSKVAAEVSAKASGGFWGMKYEVSGKVSSSRENTRSTNQTAKYQIHVGATQQKPTEGLSKLMDIMASCVEPIEA